MRKEKLFLVSIMFSFILFSCGGQKTEEESKQQEEQVVNINTLNLEDLQKVIKEREEAYRKKQSINNEDAVKLMEAYAAYANRFKNEESADEYLFKAGEIAMGLNRTVESLKYLDRLYNEYPDYDKRAYGLFLKAFVLENQAQNLEQAKLTYEKFLEEFPDHEMADDASASIQNLGKSPEQIIREFEIQDSIRKAKEAA